MDKDEEKYFKDLIYTRKKRRKLNGIESVLKDWYGDDLGAHELSSYLPKPVHLKDNLDKILSDAMGPGEYKLLDLKKNWKQLMGEQVGKMSVPVSIKNKILTIEVKNSALLMELKNYYKSLVEEKVKSFCGDNFYNAINFVPAGK